VVISLTVPPATPAPLSALSHVGAAVDALAGDDVERLSDDALREDLVALRRHIDRLELEFSRRLRGFDARRGWAGTGATSTVGWLRWACRLSTAAAMQHVDVARRLPDLPLTERSAAEGSIGFHHVGVIARCAAQVGTDAVRAVEPVLVDAARTVDPRALGIVTRRLRYCVDPDGTLSDVNAAHDGRSFTLSETYDGVFHVAGCSTTRAVPCCAPRWSRSAIARPAIPTPPGSVAPMRWSSWRDASCSPVHCRPSPASGRISPSRRPRRLCAVNRAAHPATCAGPARWSPTPSAASPATPR
jgi:Domain of unknown function (DUF222)